MMALMQKHQAAYLIAFLLFAIISYQFINKLTAGVS